MKLYPSTSVIYLLHITIPTTERILHKIATITEKLRGAISSTGGDTLVGAIILEDRIDRVSILLNLQCVSDN